MIGGVIDGKYRVLRLIGKGGMGAVYEAEDIRPDAAPGGKHVAVKVMHPPGPGERADEGMVGRFDREARAASAIKSQHVAAVLDWGTDTETQMPYIVLEYLLGEDLSTFLKRTDAIPPGVALRILAQACVGVQAAHEARVIHRDIKPANLFLAKVGDGKIVVKILDFGIAKIRPDDEHGETTGLTRPGGMLGSPVYMSPEQARGIRNIDHRTDVWSLGVVLYKALTGHTPHDDTESIGDLIVSICSEPCKEVQEVSPWVPAEIAAVAHGALRIPASERFQSAQAMLEAMQPFLPDGWELEEEMLVTIDEAARSVVAPRATEISTGGTRTVARLTTADTQVATSAASPPPRRAPSPLWTAVVAGGAALLGVAMASIYYRSAAVRPPVQVGATGASAEPPRSPVPPGTAHAAADGGAPGASSASYPVPSGSAGTAP